MNSTIIRALILSVAVLALTVGSTFAQQTTGTPGSPGATTTIDGKYLPPPPAPFGGTINLGATDSKPYWPPTVVPPKGAPNVLLIMTDDQGYGVTSWRCHPDAFHGPHCYCRTTLHTVPLNCSLLADPGGADHGPQPSLGGLRRDHRNVHWIPGVRLRHRA
jgi:hypothetical protein